MWRFSILEITLTLSLALSSLTTGFARETASAAANFDAVTSSGHKIKLSDFKGKVVVLDFWASWCKPCQKELPFLVDLCNQRKGKDFVVIAVNLDEQASNMKKFLSKLHVKVPFPIIVDRQGLIPPLYQVKAMPTTLLIDKQGVIRYRHRGFKESHKATLAAELNKLLQQK
ncbi:MAG: TlpA family protein disulfide reductase [bacterium]